MNHSPTEGAQGSANSGTPLNAELFYRNITSMFAYDDKLAKMSAKELIIEVLGSNAADYRCVNELMNRVLPDFTKVITDEETEAASDPSPEKFAPLSLSEKLDAPRTDATMEAMQGGRFRPDKTHPLYVLSKELERQLAQSEERVAKLEGLVGKVVINGGCMSNEQLFEARALLSSKTN